MKETEFESLIIKRKSNATIKIFKGLPNYHVIHYGIMKLEKNLRIHINNCVCLYIITYSQEASKQREWSISWQKSKYIYLQFLACCLFKKETKKQKNEKTSHVSLQFLIFKSKVKQKWNINFRHLGTCKYYYTEK